MNVTLRTKIRILEATLMPVVKCVSEVSVLRKMKEDWLDVSQRNGLQIVLGSIWLTVFKTVSFAKYTGQSRYLGL